MLTRRGWFAAAFAIGSVVSGRIVGIYDLYIIGATIGAVVVVAAVWVGSARLQLSVTRRVRPARMHVGELSRVELELTNVTARDTPVLVLNEAVSSTPGATAELGPIVAGGTGRVAYQLPTDRRGVIDIGPLQIEVVDPLGLASVRIIGAPADEATVYPHIMPLVPMPTTFGHDRQIRAETPNALGRVGDDFYALRDYVLGDDLRRVHWPTTARRGDLMVRHDEQPSQGRVTVLLDTRRHAHSPASFEPGVSIAASIISASTNRRDVLRIITTDGGDSGIGTGKSHRDAIMEYLALVDTSGRGSLRSAINSLRNGQGGALAYVSPAGSAEEFLEVRRAATAYGFTINVDVHRSSWDPSAPAAGYTPPAGIVLFRDEADFRVAWAGAMRRRRAGTPA